MSTTMLNKNLYPELENIGANYEKAKDIINALSISLSDEKLEQLHNLVRELRNSAAGSLQAISERDNYIKTIKEEYAVFITEYKSMRNAQLEYFAAAKKVAAERTTENYTNKKACLIRAKNIEDHLDKKAAEVSGKLMEA